MQDFVHDPSGLWLLCGAILIAFEALTAPGLGIFLAGLGAICTGIVTKSGLIAEADTVLQFVAFFAFTVLWTAALWKWLRRFRISRSNSVTTPFHNVVGQAAVVGRGGLKRGVAGQAVWSGTVMTAEIDPASPVDSLPEGAPVTIRTVSGTTLSVVPQ